MKELVVAYAMCTYAAFASLPVIDAESVRIYQDRGHAVVIEYTMNPAQKGNVEPAIVTVDILTNAVGEAAVSIGGEHLQTLSGDVNKVVAHTADGKHKILWKPSKEGMPEFTLPAVQVSAQITLWSTNSPPNFWVVDLAKPADRSADRYYPNSGQIPLGVTNAIYKTDRMVFRRIPAKGVTWKMGGEASTALTNPYRYVTFSYDYWMSVYEVTTSQYNKLRGSYQASEDNNALPMGNAFDNWRGDSTGSSKYVWPTYGHENVNFWMKNARESFGGVMVDLPTRAEWEFACRAGSSTKYCNGDTEQDLAKVAWYSGNAGSLVHEVGTKDPNAWGMFDMHGNRAEWTLDRYSELSSGPVWDPVGPKPEDAFVNGESSGKSMALCGGGQHTSGYKVGYWTASACQSDYGVGKMTGQGAMGAARLVVPLN